jgi:hypothetical protein
MMKRIFRISAFIALGIIILGLAGFLIWASTPAAPQPEALQSLSHTLEVHFETFNDWLVFTPTTGMPRPV